MFIPRSGLAFPWRLSWQVPSCRNPMPCVPRLGAALGALREGPSAAGQPRRLQGTYSADEWAAVTSEPSVCICAAAVTLL